MRVDQRLLRAGVFLVLLGLPVLLVQSEVVDPASLAVAPRLWPLILVAIGLGLLLRFTPLAALGGILVAATVGLVLGTGIAAGGSLLGGCSEGSVGVAGGARPQTGTSGGFGGDPVQVRLALDCGVVVVTTRAGTEWQVLTSADQRRPATIDATESRLSVRSNDRGRSWFDSGAVDGPDHWDVTLPNGPRMDVDTTVNAASARLRLRGARLGSVELHVNAGNGWIDLSGATVDRVELSANAGNLGVRIGPGANLSGEIDVNAGKLSICVQPGVGLEIVMRETLGSNDFAARGLARSGNTWRSGDFDSAPSRVRLQIAANAGSVALDPETGCDG